MPKKRIDLMIDLETLDTRNSTVILSCGIIPFDILDGLIEGMPTFYHHVDIDDQIAEGRTVSGATIKWWMLRSEEARTEEFDQSRLWLSVFKVMFRQYIENFSTIYEEVNVWGNGTTFDISILDDLFAYHTPYKFRSIRDVRTIVDLFKFMGGPDKCTSPIVEFLGVPHNALDDARHQAACISRMIRFITQGE